MAEYDNNLSGLMFKKPRKTDKHPILSGFVEINGEQYDVGVWNMDRVDKIGQPMYSIKLKKGEPKPATQVWPDDVADNVVHADDCPI